MNIRVMKREDYHSVYDLWLSCVGMGLNNLDDSKEGIDKFLRRNPDTCYVAEVDNEIIGVIIAGNDGRRGYIYHTAVSTEFRKQGIGRILVEKAVESLKEEGINKVALVVFDRNETGNEFWKDLGFTAREDLVYRNKSIREMIRIDT